MQLAKLDSARRKLRVVTDGWGQGAAGGAFARLSGRSFPASAEAAWCRVGSVGPVAARVESSSAIGCATPATRPTAAVPVIGPSAAVGVVSVDVVVGGWGDGGVGLPSAFPARTGSGTPSTSASASETGSGSAAAYADATTDVRTPIARVYPSGAAPDPGSLAAWLADGAARCVFSNDGGGGGGVAAAAAAGVHAVDCPVSLTPPGFVSARVVVGPHGSSVEAVGSVEIEFRPSPVVSGLRGGVDFGGGGSTASAGENAVFDVDGAGFFPGLTCVWCGVAGAEANVLSSVAARCEQPGLETLRLTSAAGAAEGVACALGLVSGGADDGLLGAAAVADGPTALITPFPGETTAVAPSVGPATGGTAATARTAGFSSSRRFTRDANGGFSCRFGTIGPVAGVPAGGGAVRCETPAHVPGAVAVVVAGARGGSSFAYVADGGISFRRDAGSAAPSAIPSSGDAAGHDAVDVYARGFGGGLAAAGIAYLCVLGDGGGLVASATARGAGWTRCGVLPSTAPSGFTTVSVAAREGTDGAEGAHLAGFVAASGSVEVYARPEARALIPRDVVSGWDSTLTLLGEHQRRGDGGTAGGGTGDAHSFWCFFGDGVAVPARSVSSALAVCEILPPAAADDERRSSSSSLASSSSSRSASDDTNASSDESDEYPTSVRRAHPRTRRVDLASPAAFDRGRGAPCGGPDSGCRSFRHFPAPLAIHRVRPTSAPVTGGSVVAMHGLRFADVPNLGCRFGTIGPTSGSWASAATVRCITPGRAPGPAPASALGTSFDDDDAVAVTFRSPVVDATKGGVVRVASRSGGSSTLVVVRSGEGPSSAEPLVATVLGVGGGGRARATCTTGGASVGSEYAGTCGGRRGAGAGAIVARFDVPAPGDRFDRFGGVAFRVVALGFDAEAFAHGGDRPDRSERSGDVAAVSSSHSASPGWEGSIEVQYLDDPVVVAAVPAAASAAGGATVTLLGAPGPSSFRVDDSRVFRCVFGRSATTMNAVSSAVAVCETPPATTGEREAGGGSSFAAVPLGASVDGVWFESRTSAAAAGGTVSFSHRAPVVTLDVAPARTVTNRYEPSTSPIVLTVTGRGFGAGSTDGFGASDPWAPACRVGTIGPLATTQASATQVRCVAPAGNGRNGRATPVAVLRDGVRGGPHAPTLAFVEFVVDASTTAFGGSRADNPSIHDSPASIARRASDALVRATDPASSTGGVPVEIRGSDVPHRRCWCLFGRAFAARVLRVSSAVSRCEEAPPGVGVGGGATRVVVRVACAWGATGPPAAALEPTDAATLSPREESGSTTTTTAATAAAFAIGESGVALSLVSRPSIASAMPTIVSGSGGVATTLTASSLQHAGGGGDDADADGDGSRYGCHFGSVGPVSARSIGEDRVECVAPALGVARVTVGVSLDANARETEWSRVVVRVDSYYLEGFLARGAEGAGMPSGGAASGGATYESVAGVAGGVHPDRKSSVVRCAFGDALVSGAWHRRGGNGYPRPADGSASVGGVVSVLCVTPPRLTSAGFVPVRIFVDGSDANALGDSAIFQYAVAPDARVRTVFPRLSWGAEVVSVAGAHLAGPGDAVGGAPRRSSGSENAGETRCVFAGVVSPARVVSSAVMTCETLAEVRSPVAKRRARAWWGPDAYGDDDDDGGDGDAVGAALAEMGAGRGEGGAVAGVAGAEGRANEGGDARRGVRAVSACAIGSDCGSQSDGFGSGGSGGSNGGANALWFQSVRASSVTAADIDEGWDDGGTLVRLALSTRTPADWLDCAFGTTRVPARPAAASNDPPVVDAESASELADAMARLGGGKNGANMDLECISPAHAPGVVDVEIALTRSRMPSSGGAVKFAYV